MAKEIQKKKGFNWKFLVIFVGIPFLFILFISSNPAFKKGYEAGKNQAVKPTATPKPAGINIARGTFMTAYNAYGDVMIFKKSKPINEQESYIGQSGRLTVQLIGPMENLVEANAVAEISSSDVNGSVLAMSKLITLMAQGGPDCSKWFVKANEEVQANGKNVPFEKTENACGLNLTLIYIPQVSLSVGIKPAN